MRVDEAPGGQAGECRLYPSRLKLWVSGKGAHIFQDSLLDALDQSVFMYQSILSMCCHLSSFRSPCAGC